MVSLESTADAGQQPAAKTQKAKQQAPTQPQELKKLQEQLKEAARKAGRSEGSRSSKVKSRSEVVAGTAAAEGSRAAAAQGPVEMYTQLFKELSPPEQNRRVEGFARLTPKELASAIHLSDAAKAAILEVSCLTDHDTPFCYVK